MNSTTNAPKSVTEEQFIQEIREEVLEGFRITPFLGSGVSAQSGIIMGEEFPLYLAWTVSQVLRKRWDVRTRGWPPFPSSNEKDEAHEYLLEKFKSWCEARKITVSLSADQDRKKVTALNVPEQADHQQQLGARDIHLSRPLVPEILRDNLIWDKEDFLDSARRNLGIKDVPLDPNMPDSSEEYITEMALRALSHWTRTLEFLARVTITKAPHSRLYLDDLDISVIDGFNAHITRGKRPNLIHNMVSRLTRSLRAQIILTTNFDTLIEQSYRAQGEPLHMLAVSIKGGLPAFATVRAQDCVVKLHGDILETRADTSINEPPSHRDKEHFFQYLRGPSEPHEPQPWDFVPSHLLVLGYSASDARCVQMIRFVLDMDDQFKVFWVCHTPNDLRKVDKIFGCYGERICTVLTDRADLLLWELYQKLNLSLPGGGYSLQFTHQVPPRSTLFDSKEAQKADAVQDLYKLIRKSTENNIVYIDCGTGTTQPLQVVFNLFKAERNNTAWFELEDYRNTDDLFFNLISIISLNLGYFQLEWINFVTRRGEDETKADEKDHLGRMLPENMGRRLRLLVEKFKINPERWVFFFYGRNGPGGCTGWRDGQNYWGHEPSSGQKTETDRFHNFLELLRQLRFRIIYLPRGEQRQKRDDEKLGELKAQSPGIAHENFPAKLLLPPGAVKATEQMDDLTLSPELQSVSKSWHPQSDMQKQSASPPFKEIIHEVMEKFGTNLDQDPEAASRGLWLYGLTLFRQSRHPAAMISEAVFPCPWRFGDNSNTDDKHEDGRPRTRDNDEYRHHLIYERDSRLSDEDHPEGMSWMGYLEAKGLFLRKPGGYAWMFRDTRIGLQRLLELKKVVLSSAPYAKGDKALVESTSQNTLDSFECVRARLHYWIGDWYMRAFYATGHFIPLMEAIYHSVQAIHHAPKYAWKGDNEVFRIALVWKAVCQLRKLLMVGRRSLLFWCPGVDIGQVFFEADIKIIRDGVERVTKTDSGALLEKSIKLREKLSLAPDIIEGEIKHLKSAVIKEAYAHGGRTCPLLGGHARSDSVIDHADPPMQTWCEVEPAHDLWLKDIIEPMVEVTSKMLQGSSFDMGTRLQAIWGANHGQPLMIARLRREWMNEWAEKSGDEAPLFQTIWLISEMMYRIVRRAKLEYHHQSLASDDLLLSANEVNVSRRWVVVCALGYEALQMCRSLSPDYHHADCDLRVRVLTLYALALGYLNRFSESNRRLNEAHAIILSGMGWPDGRELARIHIRRAEMLIWRSRHEMAKWKQEGKGAKTKAKHTRLAISWLDDAWAALERGELCLGGVSHSTYWWYRLLSLKLSCYATLAAIVEVGGVDIKSMSSMSSLLFRRRIHLPTTLLSLLRDSLIVGAGDIFRQIRVIEYAFYADRVLNKEDPDQIFKYREDRCGPFTPRTHPQLYKDIDRVMSFFLDKKNSDAAGEKVKACWRSMRKKWLKFTTRKPEEAPK